MNKKIDFDTAKEDREAGIVSTDPGVMLGKHDIPVALAGRVPVNVVGEVNIGDMLTTSSVPGKVM